MNRRELLISMGSLSAGPLAPSFFDLLMGDAPAEPATRRTRALARYEQMHLGVSYHFSMSRFTGDDYETGAVPATTYNPTHLDVRHWIRVAHDLGARYAVLTAKHMSGFCLWDCGGYDYDVAASGNKTDVVAAFVAACVPDSIAASWIRTTKAKFDWDAPVRDDYYKLIKHHLSELPARYPRTFYQLLDITWKISQEQRWELYRLIKSFSPDCVVGMNQAFYQSRRNQGRICEPASWPTDVIKH
jgi:alpha-L-fucosidase